MGKIVKLIRPFQSSGVMESAGAQSFFQYCQLISIYNIRYAHYTGDGDTESFKKVLESKPSGDDLIPCQLECVGAMSRKNWEQDYESYKMT